MYYNDIRDLKEALHQLKTGVALVLSGEKNFNFQDYQKVFSEASIPVVGAFFPGVIANKTHYESGSVLLHFDSDFEVHFMDIKDTPKTEFFNHPPKVKGTGIVLTDSMSSNVEDALNKLYFELGPDYKFVGGGAGSLSLKQAPCLFDANGLYQDKILLLLLPQNVSLGVKHGYNRIDGPLIATNVDGNTIKELNWENPFDLYAKIIETKSDKTLSKEDFFSTAKCFPLGISRQGQEDIVRDPISCTEEGEIYCIDGIPENAALYVLEGEPHKMVDGAIQAAHESVNGLTNSKPGLSLLIDCISRALFLDDEFDQEISAISGVLEQSYPDISTYGILSLGEISTFSNGRIELYNKTVLSALFHE